MLDLRTNSAIARTRPAGFDPRNVILSPEACLANFWLMSPVLLLLFGMGIVVVGILVLRLHAFLALIVGAFAVALLTPASELREYAEQRVAKGEMTAKVPDKPAAARVADEFGKTCANLGILIAMAAILGEAMLLSGAAESIAAAMLRWLGAARAHWAFFATSFLLCIPVMLDTVMFL